MEKNESLKDSMTALGQQLLKALEPIAKKMGVAAEHLYRVFTKQQVVTGIVDIAVWVSVAAFLFWTSCVLLSLGKSDSDGGYCFFGWLIRTISVLMAGAVTSANLPRILNPEYYAVRDLIYTARGEE